MHKKNILKKVILGLSTFGVALGSSMGILAEVRTTQNYITKQNEWHYDNLKLFGRLKLSPELKFELIQDLKWDFQGPKWGFQGPERNFELLDPSSGKFRYKSSASDGKDSATVRLDIHGITVLYQLNFDQSGDPLFEQQWSLHNTGQNAFAVNGGTPGADINILPVIADGITGKGVKVAVVDTGVDIDHEDLRDRFQSIGNYSVQEDDHTNPRPRADELNNYHGTSVAGIIGATAWNGIGMRGVAPEVDMVAYQYVGKYDTDFPDFLAVNGFTDLSQDVDIFNHSYGSYSVKSLPYFEREQEITQIETHHGETRNGRGAIYVKAAGNGFEKFFYRGTHYFQTEENKGYPLDATHLDVMRNIFEVVVVSATNAMGKKSSSSSVGTSVLVSAPGGEDGIFDPAIVTTDQVGCTAGKNKDVLDLALNCSYTNKMNGTSAAAANTTGVIALMLEVNPRLGWRDIQWILANTAKVVEPNLEPLELTVGDQVYLTRLGWVENAAGYHYSPTYGFGRIDAQAAVTQAKNYVDYFQEPVLTPWLENTQSLPVADGRIQGGSSRIHVEDNFVIESVQVRLNIEHGNLLQLAVELISPSGTVSQLITPYSAGPYPAFSRQEKALTNLYGYLKESSDLITPEIKGGLRDNLIRSNAFLGESAAGEWTLRVMDIASGTTSYRTVKFKDGHNDIRTQVDLENDAAGKLESWSLRIMGHPAR